MMDSILIIDIYYRSLGKITESHLLKKSLIEKIIFCEV